MKSPVQLSIVVPIYNEEPTLREVVQRTLAADVGGRRREVILVDDCSTDASVDIGQQLAEAHPEVHLRRHLRNRGKGAALRTGFEAARGELVLVQDADLEYDPADYPTLLAPFDQGADVVYGSRFHPAGSARDMRPWQRGGNWLVTQLCNGLSGWALSDMETGYKVIRRTLLSRLTLCEDRFGIEPELTMKLSRLRPRPRLVEVPIHYRSRGFDAGKKLTPLDGLRAVYAILRYRLA